MHRKRRLSLKKSRLTYVCIIHAVKYKFSLSFSSFHKQLAWEKAVKNVIKEGKIALEDKEGIDRIRKSVTVM